MKPAIRKAASTQAPQSRLVRLTRERDQIRIRLNTLAPFKNTLEHENEYYDLIKVVSDLNDRIKHISFDPLTHDLCIDQPDALECRVYDC